MMHHMGWRRLWKYAWCLEITPPRVASRPKTKIFLLLKRLLLTCFSMPLRQVYDNLWACEFDSSECDSSDSSDPPFCRETLQGATGALAPLLLFFCCQTFRRVTGTLTALPLPFRRFFVTATYSASLTSKLSLDLTQPWDLLSSEPTK